MKSELNIGNTCLTLSFAYYINLKFRKEQFCKL